MVQKRFKQVPLNDVNLQKHSGIKTKILRVSRIHGEYIIDFDSEPTQSEKDAVLQLLRSGIYEEEK